MRLCLGPGLGRQVWCCRLGLWMWLRHCSLGLRLWHMHLQGLGLALGRSLLTRRPLCRVLWR